MPPKINLYGIVLFILEFAEKHNIIISACFIPGADNSEADRLSREIYLCKNWMLDRKIFSKLCSIFFKPDNDLFANRLNH